MIKRSISATIEGLSTHVARGCAFSVPCRDSFLYKHIDGTSILANTLGAAVLGYLFSESDRPTRSDVDALVFEPGQPTIKNILTDYESIYIKNDWIRRVCTSPAWYLDDVGIEEHTRGSEWIQADLDGLLRDIGNEDCRLTTWIEYMDRSIWMNYVIQNVITLRPLFDFRLAKSITLLDIVSRNLALFYKEA